MENTEEHFIQFKEPEDMNLETLDKKNTSDELKKHIAECSNKLLKSMIDHSNFADDEEMSDILYEKLQIDEPEKRNFYKDELVKMSKVFMMSSSISPSLDQMYEVLKTTDEKLQTAEDSINKIREQREEAKNRLNKYEEASLLEVVLMKLGIK